MAMPHWIIGTADQATSVDIRGMFRAIAQREGWDSKSIARVLSRSYRLAHNEGHTRKKGEARSLVLVSLTRAEAESLNLTETWG